MGVVSVWRYLFWDVQQHKDQPHYTIAYTLLRMQKPCCQTQTVQNIVKWLYRHAFSMHCVRVLKTHLEYP